MILTYQKLGDRLISDMLKLLKIFGISLVVSIIAILFLWNGLLDSWQEKIFDKFFVTQKVSNEIVIFAIDNESIAQIGQWPWSRSVFAKTIKKLQSAAVIGLDVNFSEPSNNDAQGDMALASALANSIPKVVLPSQLNKATQETVEPLPMFKGASIQGIANMLVDQDGTVRTTDKVGNATSWGTQIAIGHKEGLFVPGSMRIDYKGPANTFLTFPISDLLNDKIPERIYNNKIALIGATAPDLHDFFQTPFGYMSGVEVNANIINTLLDQKFYRNLPIALSVFILLLCNMLAAGFIYKVKKFSILLPCLLAIIVSINIAGAVLFSYKIIFPILYADVGFIIAVSVLIIFQYSVESKEKKFIYNSFKYYLSPDIINELIANPKKLKLGGERKKVTLLFSDIRGFTTLAETLTPEQLTNVVIEHMTAMSDIVMAQKGFVVQYVGDQIMAVWGAPLPDVNQAENACLTAVVMMQKLHKLNQHWKTGEHGVAREINIGIGINTGEVVVGNIGSNKRFNYATIGDEVNYGSRLEGLNKAYGTSIIISESTKKEIENDPAFHIRELDIVMVKGKKDPKTIFELMVNPLPQNILESFNAGRKLYREGKWQEALEKFSLSMDQDAPSEIYFERCRDFQKNPPSNWEGVYEFKTK